MLKYAPRAIRVFTHYTPTQVAVGETMKLFSMFIRKTCFFVNKNTARFEINNNPYASNVRRPSKVLVKCTEICMEKSDFFYNKHILHPTCYTP